MIKSVMFISLHLVLTTKFLRPPFDGYAKLVALLRISGDGGAHAFTVASRITSTGIKDALVEV